MNSLRNKNGHCQIICARITALFVIIFFAISNSNAHAADEITYDVEINGLEQTEHKSTLDLFIASSILFREKSRPLVSIANLRNRLDADKELMDQILRSNGYYNPEISEQFIRNENHFNIVLTISPGELYRYGDISVIFNGEKPPKDIQKNIINTMTLVSGEPAKANPVVRAEANILNILPEYGFPFADKIDSNIVVDHNTRMMNVTFSINTGTRRRMGNVRFEGLDAVNPEFIRKFITWENGSCYKQSYINEFRTRLIKSNLFSGVNIDVQPEGETDTLIIVNHIEAKHRTIGISAGYSTAEGIGGEVSWQHRNFMGTGKRLRVTARASEIEQSVAGLMEIPHYKRLDQTLSFEGVLKRQDTEAFFAHVIDARAGLDRIITEDLALLANVELEYNDVTDTLGNRDFFLISFPFGVRWDSSDNLLDPNRGFRASLITAPSYGVGDDSFKFLKTEFRTSTYFSLTREGNLVLALRARLGSIIGVENEILPATKRFYSGGGGSIRGYSFQRVGPLASDDNPLGGRSVNEFAAEFRWKFENNLGFVVFAEGGNVYETTTPEFSALQYAAGVGARYATGFGPVRFDIALPLNKRTGDSSFQIYISLGQAF